VERASASTELHRRGDAYGIPGVAVDGMDVLEVEKAGRKWLAHAREGKGPVVLEMKTYRYRGHSMSDPAKYRTKEEVSKVRAEQDPIDTLAKRLLDGGVATEEALKEIDREVKDICTQASEFAQTSPFPEDAELYADILVGG
ncbi:MAG: pyruvate dehydrogenase (acetyl-transferring) E1 component subunit alpha, partial [Rhodospirillales bacterium]